MVSTRIYQSKTHIGCQLQFTFITILSVSHPLPWGQGHSPPRGCSLGIYMAGHHFLVNGLALLLGISVQIPCIRGGWVVIFVFINFGLEQSPFVVSWFEKASASE